jgi:hypothetical protein
VSEATSQFPLELRELDTDFEFVRELGRGGAAVVYLARERSLGRKVAIKVVRGPYLDPEEALARLEREARVVARLEHPNIVAVHTVRRLEGGSLAVVMQYVPGGTLKEAILREAPFDFARAEGILRDVGPRSRGRTSTGWCTVTSSRRTSSSTGKRVARCSPTSASPAATRGRAD